MLDQRHGLSSRLLLAQVLFLALLWFGHVDYKGLYAQSDLAQYRLIAQAAPSLRPDIPAPFAFRLAVPFLAGVISPHDDVFAFDLLHIIFLVTLALQFHRVLRRYAVSRSYALIAASLILWNPYLGGFLCFNAFQAGDTLAYILLLVAFEAVIRRQFLLLSTSLLIGSFVRETPLLIIPAVLLAPNIATRDRTRYALAAIPALVSFFALRMFIPVSNPDWSIFSTLWSYAPYVFSLERWVRLGISAFAPLSLLLLLMPLRYTFHLREATPAHLLVVLIFAASFLGGDAERLVSPALFFLLIIFREQLSLLLLSRRFGILLAFAVLICSNHFLFHAHPLMTREWYYGSSMILSIIVAVAGYMTMKRHVGTNEEAHYGGDEQPA